MESDLEQEVETRTMGKQKQGHVTKHSECQEEG